MRIILHFIESKNRIVVMTGYIYSLSPSNSAFDIWLALPVREMREIYYVTVDEVYGSRQTSYFFSHMSHSCSTHLTLKVFCLDIYLSQRLAITDIHIICVSRFSIVSFTFFSTASNSSSKRCIFLTSPSFIIDGGHPLLALHQLAFRLFEICVEEGL
jgi:hypothetical protein